MFKTTTLYTVEPDAYLDTIFKEIPSNAFINKGRCGIGGTTLELDNITRCSIIVAPTVGILKDKEKSTPGLFIVWAKVTVAKVKAELALRKPGQKIMCTPEGIKKVIDAAIALKMFDELKTDWFLLLDEIHSFVSEYYRKNILTPFKYFWDFQRKAVISATPYFFSDQRFYDLDYHKIKFTRTLGTITVVNCKSVAGTVDMIITKHPKDGGKLFIFLNSVTEIKRVAERANLEVFGIYCADDEDKENMKKLGDMAKHYIEEPDVSNFQPVNFFTSKYFEGWDLFAEDATIVLVTDIHIPHTLVPVGTKLKQAAGRLRTTPKQIFHVTNSHNINAQPKSLASFKEHYTQDAERLFKQYVQYHKECKEDGRKPEEDPRLARYADYEYKTKIASLNRTKIDQQINHAYGCEMYINIDLIENEWRNAYYDVVVEKSKLLLETKTTMKRKSKAKQLEEDFYTIINYKEERTGQIEYSFGPSPEETIRVTNPLAYQAAKLLTSATMVKLGFNVKKVQAEVILASNMLQEVKLLRLLNNEFKQGDRFSRTDIAATLQRIYNQLGILDLETGKVRVAKATDLRNERWFDIDDCKVQDKEGFYTIHAFLILRPTFNMRVAS